MTVQRTARGLDGHEYKLSPLACSLCGSHDLTPHSTIQDGKDSQELETMLRYTYYKCPNGHTVSA